MEAPFTIGGVYSSALDLFEKKWKLLVSATIVYFIVTMAASRISVWVSTKNPLSTSLASLLLNLLTLIFSIGFIQLALKLARKEEASLNDLIPTSINRYLKVLGGGIAVALVVFLGFILFIIPGIILSLRYSQVTYLLIDQDLSIREAFHESNRLTWGARTKVKIFLLGITSLLCVIAGLLLFIVGIIVAFPVIILAHVCAYLAMRQAADADMGTDEAVSGSLPASA